jgi:SpoVK/Ycf46/Vps4 family AAA+-type ATPase
MARSDLLLSLVKAGTQGDRTLFHRTVDAMIAEERAKQHHVLADQLERSLERSSKKESNTQWTLNGPIQALLHEVAPLRSLDTVVLPSTARQACKELIEEQCRADLLRAHNLEPRHRILLIGPPGNGKTCLAEALAEALALPLLMVRYEGVVGSFLGETASRLNRLFEHVLTRPCVLFFDEFDTLGKERGDVHDTGEIKRVVSSLLLQIDRLPSYVVVVAATNHQELLDRAVWRRFEIRLELPRPSTSQIDEWFHLASKRWEISPKIWKSLVSARLRFESFAELEQYALDVIRRLVLSQGSAPVEQIITDRITQWKSRAKKSSS